MKAVWGCVIIIMLRHFPTSANLLNSLDEMAGQAFNDKAVNKLAEKS